MDEKLLLNQIKNDNQLAFKQLFDVYYPPLCAYLKNFTTDNLMIDELAQSTFVSFWKQRHKLEIKTSVKGYLFRMAYHRFLKVYENDRKKDKMLAAIKYDVLNDMFIEQEDELDARINQLKASIDALPKKNKEILLLKRQGYKNREISEELGLSIKTVEAHIRTAYKKIKEDFKNNHLILYLNYMSIKKYLHG